MMPPAKTAQLKGLKKVDGKPVELLLHGRQWEDDPMLIIRYTDEGFDLHDVINMLSTSELYLEDPLVRRITGKSVRTVRRLAKELKPARLGPQQSMVAFQYARVLEFATQVFGRQSRAEDWLKKSSKYLNGHVPLELIENPLGFRLVEDYLSRIKYGVYQ